MADVYFESIHTKSRFRVVKFNKDDGTVTLVGRHGVPFDQKYSKDHFEDMGYRPVKGDETVQAAPPAPPAPTAPPPPPAATAVPPPPPVPQAVGA